MNFFLKKSYLFFLLKFLFFLNVYSINVFAQIEIIDQSHHDIDHHSTTSESSLSSSESTEILLKVQNLEKELRFLRGSVEELNYVLDQLRQNRIEDYIDLDNRLTTIAIAIKEKNTDLGDSKDINISENNNNSSINQNNYSAEEDYRKAYQLVKEQKFDKAKIEFISFVEKYNDPFLTPKSYFWLGELYYWSEEYIKSKEVFNKLINEYPNHRKIPDSKFKIAKIFFNLGEKRLSKRQLESLVENYPKSNVLNPAREFLRNNFD